MPVIVTAAEDGGTNADTEDVEVGPAITDDEAEIGTRSADVETAEGVTAVVVGIDETGVGDDMALEGELIDEGVALEGELISEGVALETEFEFGTGTAGELGRAAGESDDAIGDAGIGGDLAPEPAGPGETVQVLTSRTASFP